MAYDWNSLVSSSSNYGKIAKTFWNISVQTVNDIYRATSGSATCTSRYDQCSGNYGNFSNKVSVNSTNRSNDYGDNNNLSDCAHNSDDVDLRSYQSTDNGSDNDDCNDFSHNSQNSDYANECIPAGTLILLKGNRTERVENLKPQDVVVSFNLKTQKLEDAVLEKCESFIHKKIITISFKDKTLQITESHPIYTNKGWAAFAPEFARINLNGEDCIKLEEGLKALTVDEDYEEILKITVTEKKIRVYNPQVSLHHTYFANGFLVHNKIGQVSSA